MDIVKLFHMCFFMHIYCFHIYLNSIVAVVMMLCVCQYHVMPRSQCCKLLKKVKCKFYKYLWHEQYCMLSNLILLNLKRTTNSFFKQHKTLSNLPFQRFIPISAFSPYFSVLSPFQQFIPISAFYPYFSVLSLFQFPFPPFSFNVLSRPLHYVDQITKL